MEYPLVRERMVSRRRAVKEHQVSTPHYYERIELYYMLRGKITYFIDAVLLHAG